MITDATTRFVTQSICEHCGHDGWGSYRDERRCHACGRIVTSDAEEAAAEARQAAFALTGFWLATPGASIEDLKPLLIELIEALDREGDIRAGDA